MKLDTKHIHHYIAQNANLRQFYNYYLENCLSLNVPYHNMRHTLGMMYHIIRIYELSNDGSHEYYGFRLSQEDLYVLLVSALFHDYNHSAGRFADDVNVNNAINGLRACVTEILEPSDTRDMLLTRCERNIRATQYPYVISDDILDLHQRIMRECDILVILFDDMVTQSIMGLSLEMHQTNLTKFVVDYLRFILERAKGFRLAYAVDTWKDNTDWLMGEIDAFAKIISEQEKGGSLND